MDKNSILSQLFDRYPALSSIRIPISEAASTVAKCFSNGGKLLVCGNGGSSSDADHVVGELMKCFESERPLQDTLKDKLVKTGGVRGKYLAGKLERGFPAISLSAHTALTTAVANDIDANLAFAQQVNVYGTLKDVLLAISSSGNSQNVVDACLTARAIGLKVVGLTGKTGGKMKEFCDILINVPESRTAFVQELHLPVLHSICLIAENNFFVTQKAEI